MFSRSFINTFRGQATRSAATLGRATAPRAMLWAAGAAGALAVTATVARPTPIHLEGPVTIAGEAKTVKERSYVMIKPDGTARQLVGEIISTFEKRGYKLVGLKAVVPSEELAKEHYSDLSSKPFYPSLVSYITSGVPVVAMVWEGKDVINQGRRIVGATNPLAADPGSVRGKYAISIGRNLIHASDSFESATKEIGLWFKENELANYETANFNWVFADN